MLNRATSCLGQTLVLLLLISHIGFSLAFVSSKRSVFTRATSPTRLFSAISSVFQPDGLLDKESFRDSCRLDETLVNLRKQLPSILTVPLTKKSASLVYSEDIQLVCPKGEVLSSGIEELVTLSATLVAGTLASQTAQRALRRSFPDVKQVEDGKSDAAMVDCNLVWNTQLTLIVKWNSTIQLIGGETKAEGISELSLDKSGRVSTLKLLDISLNGRTIVAVGEALARLRSAVRSVPFPKDSPLFGAFAEVRDGLLAAAQQPQETKTATLSPLYVGNSTNTTFLFPRDNKAPNAILIDDSYNLTTSFSPFPLPGSAMWQEYVSSHKALLQFWNRDIPILAGEVIGDEDDAATSCNFATNATLMGPDKKKTVLLRGGTRIVQAYQALASLRRASNGVWSVQSAQADWRKHTLQISWTATIPTGITTIEGSDKFTLNRDHGLVETIQQLKLSVGGNPIVDPEPVRAFWVALEASDGVVPGGDFMSDIIRRLGSAGSTRPTGSGSSYDGPPQLRDEAAASVYNLMCALHRDCSNLQDLAVAPASLFLSDEIALRGYMGESLAKGSSAYRQVVGVILASLRGAIRTNTVSMQDDPSAIIQFTPRGNLKVSLFVSLIVNTLGTLPKDSGFGAVGRVPLKLELVSEYRLDNDGKVKEHRLLESRINGQLTPADVVSRWIKGLLSPSERSSNNNVNGMSALMDVVSWARSMGSSSSTR